MKSVHHDGFSDAELAEYRPIIFKNVLDCANTIAVHMKKFGLECVESANKVSLYSIFSAISTIWCRLRFNALPPFNLLWYTVY